MTDRFIKFLQVELNDFLGKYDDNSKDSSSKEKDEGVWGQIYDFFAGEDAEEKAKKEAYDKQRNQQDYRKNRQSRNRTYNNYNNSYNSGSTYQNPQNEEKKHYDALEVRQGASFEEIKMAYKNAIKKYHPDRFANDPQKQKYAIELAQKLNEAYTYFKKKFGK